MRLVSQPSFRVKRRKRQNDENAEMLRPWKQRTFAGGDIRKERHCETDELRCLVVLGPFHSIWGQRAWVKSFSEVVICR